MNQLEQLGSMSVVVADTSDFSQLAQYRPRDATTNPSLVVKAASQTQYRELLERTIRNNAAEPLDGKLDAVAVAFGLKILKLVPGRVSTEVDARLSFDTKATLERARSLIARYARAGVPKERVLIKIAATWEGIKAAEILELEGIHCNLTLLFSIVQAHACALRGITLISPFVGRILDWYKKEKNVESYASHEDPGVLSVKSIYAHFKQHGFTTEIMGASFRNIGEIRELAGCDLLTISPELLAELSQSSETLSRRLDPGWALTQERHELGPDEGEFRWRMNEDAMATEKLAQGIRTFAADLRKLEALIQQISS